VFTLEFNLDGAAPITSRRVVPSSHAMSRSYIYTPPFASARKRTHTFNPRTIIKKKMAHLIRIPMFSGTGEWKVDSFIKVVETAYGNPENLTAFKLAHDETRLMVLTTHTTGEALKHILSLPTSIQESWDDLMDAMRLRWKPFGQVHRLFKGEFEMEQWEDDTLDDYIARSQEVWKHLEDEDREVFSEAFVDGLADGSVKRIMKAILLSQKLPIEDTINMVFAATEQSRKRIPGPYDAKIAGMKQGNLALHEYIKRAKDLRRLCPNDEEDHVCGSFIDGLADSTIRRALELIPEWKLHSLDETIKMVLRAHGYQSEDNEGNRCN
jgi:hypothetical protein